MNTHTPFILSFDERRQLEAAWRARLHQGDLEPTAFALYALLRGKAPLRGFSPVSNPAKLANGYTPYQSCARALQRLHANAGWHLPRLWPELKEGSLGAGRYEEVLRALAPALSHATQALSQASAQIQAQLQAKAGGQQ